MPARTAAGLVQVGRHTATLFRRTLREIIAERGAERTRPDGAVEAEGGDFGGRRKGGSGRGAGGKVIVFGPLKRGGRAHAAMIPDVRRTIPLPIVHRRIVPDDIVHTDALRSHDTLTVQGFRRQRINHEKGSGPGGSPIDGIDDAWSQPRRHLRRHNGIPRSSFHLFLAECEGRPSDSPAAKLRESPSWRADIPSTHPGPSPHLGQPRKR